MVFHSFVHIDFVSRCRLRFFIHCICGVNVPVTRTTATFKQANTQSITQIVWCSFAVCVHLHTVVSVSAKSLATLYKHTYSMCCVSISFVYYIRINNNRTYWTATAQTLREKSIRKLQSQQQIKLEAQCERDCGAQQKCMRKRGDDKKKIAITIIRRRKRKKNIIIIDASRVFEVCHIVCVYEYIQETFFETFFAFLKKSRKWNKNPEVSWKNWYEQNRKVESMTVAEPYKPAVYDAWGARNSSLSFFLSPFRNKSHFCLCIQ